MPVVSAVDCVIRGDVHTPFGAQLADAFQIGQSLSQRSRYYPGTTPLPNQACDPVLYGVS